MIPTKSAGFVRVILLIAALITAQFSFAQLPRYQVVRQSKPLTIDGNWNKKQWGRVKAVNVSNFIRQSPAFKPDVQAKMSYDDTNIYIIFRVHDRFVRTVATEINGRVWEDAAVEFFFAPDTSKPATFFNLEINSGGTPLLGYRPSKPAVEDIRQIEIAHTLPKTTDPEIADPITWVIEARIPLAMLEKYGTITRPKKGVSWRGNFYKIAENNSNPHYAAWSNITAPNPHFHMPAFFGFLDFK